MGEAKPPSLKQRAVFRADASPSIGGGHIMRCMALAEGLARRGVAVVFATARMTHQTVPTLAASGYEILDVEQDATLVDLLREAGMGRHDMLVVDHYGVGVEDVSACRALLGSIMVIDDLADGPRDCDLLLNQNILGSENPYPGLLPNHARTLLGPGYALLRPGFAALREKSIMRRQAGELERVFVSFGLTDVGGWALWVAQALADSPYQVDVAVGASAPSVPELRELARRSANVTLHVDAPNAAEIMAAADIAIGAGGSTSWERCCLGIPSIIGIVAENQRSIAEGVARLGAALLITPEDRHELRNLLDRLRRDPAALRALQQQSEKVCDGTGVERVADAVLALSPLAKGGDLVVRPATPSDRADFWLIRNEPATRAVSSDSAAIAWGSHASWWQGALTSPHRLLLAAELDGRVVGYVRFDREDSGAFVTSIALATAMQGGGLGGRVLKAGLDGLASRHPDADVIARVHQNNIVSINLFKRCGLSEAGAEGQFLVLRRSFRRDPTGTPGAPAWN